MLAAHVEVIPLTILCGVVQVLPPFADALKPTLSWVLPDG
jgi:hypothetical protein